MADRVLPNPNSSNEQLMGEALHTAKEQLIYTKNIDKATVYESQAQQEKVKKNTEVNKKQQEEIKQLQDGTASGGGIKQANINLSKQGPISQNLEKTNENAEDERTRREKWKENFEKTVAAFKEAASVENFAHMTGAAIQHAGGKAYTLLTHDTKTGRDQFMKGMDKLTNGLGEFGPIINGIKTAFHSVRAAGDLFVGSIRAIKDGAVGAWNFGKNVVGLAQGKGWGVANKEKDMAEAAGGALALNDYEEAGPLSGISGNLDLSNHWLLGEGAEEPYWMNMKSAVAAGMLEFLQQSQQGFAQGDAPKQISHDAIKALEAGAEPGSFYVHDTHVEDKLDHLLSALGAKSRSRADRKQRSRDKIQEEGNKRAKQLFKRDKKDRADRKKTAASSKKTAAMRFGKYILFFGLILAALAALKWALGNVDFPGVMSSLGRIAGEGLSAVGRWAGRGMDAVGRVSQRFSNWRSGQGFRTNAQLTQAGSSVAQSSGGWRNTRAGQFATKWGTRLARGAPIIASTAEGVMDWRDASKKEEKIDHAYKNQIPLAGLDGEGSPPRPMTKEEYDNYKKELRSDKAGSVGRAAGGWGGAWLGFKAGAAVGSFGGPVGTIVGGILGAIGGGIWGARKGDEIATGVADTVQGGVDRQAVDHGPWWKFGFGSNEGNRGTAGIIADQVEIPSTGVNLENSEMEIAENRVNNQVRGAGNTNITNTNMTQNSGNTESIFTGTVDMNDGMFFRPNYRPLGAQ